MKTDRVLWVGMTVYDGHSAEERILKQDRLNFFDRDARQLIGRTSWWALTNGHEIVTWACQPGERVEHIDSREEA